LRKKAQQKQVKTVVLQQRLQVRFHTQGGKMSHGARFGRHSRNKSIIVNQIN